MTLDYKIDIAVKLALELDELVSELEEDYSYLSEESDRWKRNCSWDVLLRSKKNTCERSIVEHVLDFEKKSIEVRKHHLTENEKVREIFLKGDKIAQRIRNNVLISYDTNIGRASVGGKYY